MDTPSRVWDPRMNSPSITIPPPPFTPSASSAPRAEVRMLDARQAKHWDDFVWRQPSSTFFHLTGWMRVIQKTFGYRPRYLYSTRGERITGVLPLFEVSNWILGRCLISTPFAVYGGICAEDQDSHDALVAAARSLAHAEEVEYLELRQRAGGPLQDFHRNPLYVSFKGTLDPDPELMLKRLPRDTRYMIRKAEKNSLRLERSLEKTGQVYDLFTQSMHRLGTPVFPRRLFVNLVEEFRELADVLLVLSPLGPVCGVLSFRFRDTLLPYYSGANPEANSLAANNFMYWELMKYGAAEGLRIFDFGRSKKGTGAYAFKNQWNMQVDELNYQIHLVRRETLPNFNPLNPKFERAVRFWKRLPLGVANLLGPHVVRWFP